MGSETVLVITQGKGFQMKFANGNTVSVQFGAGNYCENRDKPFGSDSDALSKDAEVAAWDSDGTWYSFDYDTVRGWLTADEVANFISFVSKSNLAEDKWEVEE